MTNIKLAHISDVNLIIDFYKSVSNDQNNKARWHYGLYPTDEDLIKDIINKELYILIDDNTICSAAVIQMHEDDLYKDVNWKNHNPAVIHLLATHPIKQHKGYAKQLLLYLFEVARNNNKDSIHLDIVKDNDYAKNLYESVGFVLIEDKELYYPDTGTILSTLFELQF